jgi:predicted MFS family arabinose efflux permease
VTYALQSRLLQGVTLGISVAMLGIGAVNVLFVPFLRHVFEAPPAALGGVHTAQGVGMLVGGLLIGSLGKRLLPLRVAVGAILILGVSVVLFGFAPQYTAVLLIMPLAGLTLPPINASLQTILQRGVPRKLLGRAGAVVDMTTTVANLVSMGVAGWVADLMGLRETFYLSGALLLLGALAMGGLLRGEMAVPSEEDPQPELALALVDEPAIASD